MSQRESIIEEFHKLYYYDDKTTTYWNNIQILKTPLDLWIFQEIINEIKPDLIIETGTCTGGSALFLANLFDLIGSGEVITIDIEHREKRPKHDRIHYILGSSLDDLTLKTIIEYPDFPNMRVMVILDSDHVKSHVLKELEVYSKLVTKGSYLIVEDTDVNGHPIYPEFGDGPLEAVEEFLKTHSEFEIDKSREKFMMTSNPSGYLKRL